MYWTDALAQFIEDNGLGTQNTDLFIGDMRDDNLDTPVVAITEYNGRNVDTMTIEPVAVDVPGLQIAVRAKSYEAARTRIVAIRRLLCMQTGQTIHGQRFVHIGPNGTLHDLNRDGNGKQQFTANLEVHV